MSPRRSKTSPAKPRRVQGSDGIWRTPRVATKTPVNLRVDNDVLAALKDRGQGWQTFANAALRAAVLGGDDLGLELAAARPAVRDAVAALLKGSKR